MPVITRFPGGGITKSKQITNLKAVESTSESGALTLTWTNPSDVKFKGLEIFYKKGSKPSKYGDGTKCYDSNDRTVATKLDLTNFEVSNTYYFRAFAYTYKNATRIYTEVEEGAVATITLKFVKGKIAITSSQTWTVPSGVTKIDVFLVGAGGGSTSTPSRHSGGGGGYTKTFKGISVTPGSKHSIVVGSGVSGANGGATKFDSYVANGGNIGQNGGSGGSGGGCNHIERKKGEDGAFNGRSCSVGRGQGSTTREFGEATTTLYSGGGGGGVFDYVDYDISELVFGKGGAGGGGRGCQSDLGNGSGYGENIINGQDGTPGTGGGGGAAGQGLRINHQTKGGSGVCIIRWGY